MWSFRQPTTLIVSALLAVIVALFIRDYYSTNFDANSVRHKRVFITGATRGIGRHVALYYARLGANIVISGRNEAALIKVCPLLTAMVFTLFCVQLRVATWEMKSS